jgi:hypothetical protein
VSYGRIITNWKEECIGDFGSKKLGVDGRIILTWILEMYGGKLWTWLIWLRIGASGWGGGVLVNTVTNLQIP